MQSSGTGTGLGQAEERLLRRARHGDLGALGALWDSIVDEVWSVARGLLEEQEAEEVVLAAREALKAGASGLAVGPRWVEVPFARLYEEVHGAMGLPPLGSLDPAVWMNCEPPQERWELHQDSEAARRAVRQLPPALRLIELFTLLTPCTVDGIARFAGVRPSFVRQARSAATWRVLQELRS